MRTKYDVGVFFVGKYTNLIGPPKSMLDLSILLAEKYTVYTSKNLTNNISKNINNTDITRDKTFLHSVISFLKSRLKKNRAIYEAHILYILIKFNLVILFFHLTNPNAKIIITQPFCVFNLIPSLRNKMIYIRRANMVWGAREKTAKPSIIKKIFDGIFFKYRNIDLVYLVPQEKNSQKHHVIPNYFDGESWEIKSKTNDILSVFFVGTWCKRKGADIFISLLNSSSSEKLSVNVFGALGSNEELNQALLSSKMISYHGRVDKPASYMRAGDVFISSSRVEGLQRSLMEAMLAGCVIVASKRPDTIFLNGSNGMFISDFHNATHMNILEKLSSMPKSKREALGEENRNYVIQNFSKLKILNLWVELINEK